MSQRSSGTGRPGTILLTGLSASGKTTLGRRLHDGLLQAGVPRVKLLDGEEVRAALEAQGRRYGYTASERAALALELAHMARSWNDQGYVSIVCAILHLRKTREQVRSHIGRFMEVYLDCPVSVCAAREYKGHYQKAFAGLYDSFIGVTEPYEVSDQVELVLPTGTRGVDECCAMLLPPALAFARNGGPR